MKIETNINYYSMAREKDDGKGRMGGRAKGTENKTTRDVKALIAKFADDKFDDVVEEFDKLDGKDKVMMYTNLIKFVLPPARDIEAEENIGNHVSAFITRLFDREKEQK